MKKTVLILLIALFLIGGLSFVLAEDKVIFPNSNANTKNKVDLVCMQKAVETRETAVAAAYDKQTTTIKSGLAARKLDLIEAWKKQTVRERTLAIVAASKKFRSTRFNAHKTYQQEVRLAWTAYKQQAKVCRNIDKEVEGNATDLSL